MTKSDTNVEKQYLPRAGRCIFVGKQQEENENIM
jgi:hypothetical protein